MKVIKRKGQNTAEYAILIALVIAAAIGIQTYVKRGWQGRLKDEADGIVRAMSQNQEVINAWNDLETRTDINASEQFEPYDFSRLAHQNTTQDYVSFGMEAGGATETSFDRQTIPAAVGDYQKYEYNNTTTP